MVASSFRQTGLTESRAHAASMPCSQSGKPSVSLAVPSRLVLAHISQCSHTQTHNSTCMHIQTQSTDTQQNELIIFAVCLCTNVAPIIGLLSSLITRYKQWRLCPATWLWVSAPWLGVKTVLVLSPSERFDSSMLFSFHDLSPSSSLCPAQRVDPAQHRHRKIYLFIIAAASQQWLSTQKPLGGDWVPDLFDSKLLCRI